MAAPPPRPDETGWREVPIERFIVGIHDHSPSPFLAELADRVDRRGEKIGRPVHPIARHDLPFPLLSDPDHAVARKHGVWVEKSLYGRRYMGIQRATFVIDEKGKLKAVFPKVKVAGHVDEVLAVL